MKQAGKQSLIAMLFVFFGWGFVTCLNDFLIPKFTTELSLSHYQANLVQFAFFGAYFFVSLLFIILGSIVPGWTRMMTNRTNLLVGLSLAAIGSFMMIPAGMAVQFNMFLLALLVIGAGFTFLQIAANPMMLRLGNPDTAASRLNMAQGFNSLAYTVAPLIAAGIFLAIVDFHGVMLMYGILGIAFLLLGAVIWFSIPKTKIAAVAKTDAKISDLFKHPIMIAGMTAIFLYVGGEVSIGSNLVTYLTSELHVKPESAGIMLAIYWGGAMIGRFLGSIAMSQVQKGKKFFYMLLTAIVLLGLIGGINTIKGLNPDTIFVFAMIVLAACLVFNRISDKRLLLSGFAVINIIIVAIATFVGGALGAYLLLSVGLFNSIMWSNIFDIATETVPAELVSAASSLLIMMIFGGALLPPLQGKLADLIGIKLSFLVPIVSYIYIFGFAVFCKRLEK
ncbi:MAG: MFS transporter [Negativicutes bacterium]|jgi:FHS family L-fucose permease-like MFS transporter